MQVGIQLTQKLLRMTQLLWMWGNRFFSKAHFAFESMTRVSRAEIVVVRELIAIELVWHWAPTLVAFDLRSEKEVSFCQTASVHV